MKKIILTAIILTLFVTTAFPQGSNNVSKVGTTAAAFLDIGVGARALAMGDAFTSLVNDATAMYWNPAGIAVDQTGSATFYHCPWLADVNFNYAGATAGLGGSGTIGAYITAVSMDEMNVRTIRYPDGNGEQFNSNNLAIGLSWGRKFTSNFAFGATVKYVQEQIWHMKAEAFAADLGIQFTTANRGVKIGMAVTNFGPKMQLLGRDTKITADIDENKAGNNDRIDAHLDTWKWPLPLNFQFGLSSALLATDKHNLVLAVDANHPNNNVEYVNLGMEYALMDMIFIRAGHAGLFMDDLEQGWSFGAGYHYRIGRGMAAAVDYVVRDFGDLGVISGFSMGVNF